MANTLMDLELIVNGKHEHFEAVRDDALLVDLLHDHGLTATKFSCGIGACGACKVAVRSVGPGAASGPWMPVLACFARARAMQGLEVLTTEGLSSGDELHPLQRAFLEDYAFQCGYSTSGFLMAGFCLLERLRQRPAPKEQGAALVQDAVAGHICRCTGYLRYARSIEHVLVSEGALVDGAELAREPDRPVTFRLMKQSGNDLVPKVLVGGFREVSVRARTLGPRRFDTLEATVSIEIASLVTGEPVRDYNLAKFFFVASDAITLEGVSVTPIDSAHELDDVFVGTMVPVTVTGMVCFAGFELPVSWEAFTTSTGGALVRLVSRAPCSIPLAAADFAAEFGLTLGPFVEVSFDIEFEIAHE